ncbi:MAG TPA: enoyl-CoA hydratase/isomerase family protein, partial [Blastocatellia bacterium]|nr:enoyl-CoA hydratase/isomerase family protein [Blastocatellia bacterium]
MDQDLQYQVDDGIATVTFNRPSVLNALTFEMYAQLRDLLAEFKKNPEVKVLILTGAGKAFCAGGDVHEIIGKLLDQDMRQHLEFA